MRKFAALVVLAALPLLATVAIHAAITAPPEWAYAIAAPPPPVPPGTTPPPNPAATDTLVKNFAGFDAQIQIGQRQLLAVGARQLFCLNHSGNGV